MDNWRLGTPRKRQDHTELVLHDYDIGAFLGIAAGSHYVLSSGFVPNIPACIVMALVLPVLGIFIVTKSNIWLLSLLGYWIMIVPLGIFLSYISTHAPYCVLHVSGMTTVITLMMGLMAIIYPTFFARINRVRIFALGTLLLIILSQSFLPLSFGIWDYVGAGFFAFYIGWEMYRATKIMRSVDNAVDICAELHLDILNSLLFFLKVKNSFRCSKH